MIKQAIVFAAGLGTRLQPLTNNKPKVLVEVWGKPILELIIDKLIASGFKKIVVNTHYFANQVELFLKSKNFDADIIISYEEDILETGGGLVNAKKYFDEGDILIYNGDILTDIDVSDLWNKHIESDCLVTLASFPRTSTREFIWDSNNVLCGWRNTLTNEYKWSNKVDNYIAMPFGAVHVVSTNVFNYLPTEGKFSLTPLYLEIAKTKTIKNQIVENTYWFDIGSIDKLQKANDFKK
ncbi:MAG: nucleotidyltransferase family protein [Ichthyobacteriaceae bacterium]|nr:nucleotidyltransferase family protein [Ichthyobacteriaceae bacterium]